MTKKTTASLAEIYRERRCGRLLSLLFTILCWVALAWNAYNEKDRRHHHLTATWADDDELPDRFHEAVEAIKRQVTEKD